jgi:NAD(P)H dehydrogenase (quinone)
MYAVTGATGNLGRLVVAELLKTVPSGQIVALVRDPAKAADLAAQGVVVRQADYDRPETLPAALAAVERLLLISGNELGKRAAQHAAVIDAAKAAGVKLIAYTSILGADASPVGLAEEHRQTEALIRASGLPYALLRNGWYIENYLGSVAPALQFGAVLGASGEGRISAATRADYAAAAAAVLTAPDIAGQSIYELAGDQAFTMADFAAELARQSGKPVAYTDMSEADYAKALEGVGLPPPVAAMLAQSSASIGKGALYSEARQLSALIGRPTTPLAVVVAAAMAT